MAVTLSINVGSIDAALASFDVIKILRSTTGVGGVYGPITAISPVAATLTAPTAGNYTVVSQTLQFIIDQGAQINHIFTGVDPLTAAQVASQLNTAAGETIAFDDSGTLRFTSNNTGLASRIEIVGGAGADAFGWVAGDRDVGEAAHIQLVADQSIYGFTDDDGLSSYFYKAVFFNTLNGLSSAESPPFQGDAGTVVDASTLSTAKVDLINFSGRALAQQQITFYGVDEAFQVGDFQLSLTRRPETIVTDNTGHAEIPLIKGSTVKVVFVGTTLIRELVVPNTPEFDLMAVLGAAPDPLKIVDIVFPAAPRRTL